MFKTPSKESVTIIFIPNCTPTQENLKKEIEQLHEQLEHNPFVMRYVVENQSLRAQNRKLKAMEAVQSGEAMAAAKAQELEKLFLELREG